MKKSKIVQLLRSCEASELGELGYFLASPYHNQDEAVIRLYQYLQNFSPDFSGPGLNKKAVFQRIFPNQAYDDKQLRYLMSDLNKLTERFLALRKVEQQPHQLTLALLESLSERGLDKSYRKVSRQLENDLSTDSRKNSEVFWIQLQWSEIKEGHFLRQRTRKHDASLQYYADDLDKYYFLNRLKIACAMLDRQTIFQATYELNLSSDWIRHVEQQQFFNEPIIQVYYTIYQALLKEEEEQYFENLKQFLREHAPAIAIGDLKDIYLFAINYCARKIRQGKEAYVTEALQLYRTGIEDGLLIDKQGLSP